MIYFIIQSKNLATKLSESLTENCYKFPDFEMSEHSFN